MGLQLCRFAPFSYLISCICSFRKGWSNKSMAHSGCENGTGYGGIRERQLLVLQRSKPKDSGTLRLGCVGWPVTWTLKMSRLRRSTASNICTLFLRTLILKYVPLMFGLPFRVHEPRTLENFQASSFRCSTIRVSHFACAHATWQGPFTTQQMRSWHQARTSDAGYLGGIWWWNADWTKQPDFSLLP